MSSRLACAFLGCLVALGACRPSARDALRSELDNRDRRFAIGLASTSANPTAMRVLARWILPRELGEISGLALATDGSVFAHGDERGQIFRIDPRRGVVLKRFTIGTLKSEATDDFEGMTTAERRLFVVSSSGMLYEFAEGAAGEQVRFSAHDTQLEGQCEFEGVAWDPSLDAFLLACKDVATRDLRGHLVVYRWRLRPGDEPLAPLTIPLSRVIGTNPWKQLHPSDITVDPATGNYVIIAAQERALIVITPRGEVVRSTTLPGVHAQAEAVALTAEGILIVGDEATTRAATLTLYHWPLTAVAPVKP